jgi:hypothetical protein
MKIEIMWDHYGYHFYIYLITFNMDAQYQTLIKSIQ